MCDSSTEASSFLHVPLFQDLDRGSLPQKTNFKKQKAREVQENEIKSSGEFAADNNAIEVQVRREERRPAQAHLVRYNVWKLPGKNQQQLRFGV